MLTIPLQAIPNQSVSIRLDSDLYTLVLKVTKNVMSVDISRNGTILLQGQRAVSGFPLIPYQYLTNGNFIFLTNNFSYPDYTQFGISQYLIFASQAELEAINGT